VAVRVDIGVAKINAQCFAKFFKVRIVRPTSFFQIEALSEFRGERAVNKKYLATINGDYLIRPLLLILRGCRANCVDWQPVHARLELPRRN
jgi:hypothetical protein